MTHCHLQSSDQVFCSMANPTQLHSGNANRTHIEQPLKRAWGCHILLVVHKHMSFYFYIATKLPEARQSSFISSKLTLTSEYVRTGQCTGVHMLVERFLKEYRQSNGYAIRKKLWQTDLLWQVRMDKSHGKTINMKRQRDYKPRKLN